MAAVVAGAAAAAAGAFPDTADHASGPCPGFHVIDLAHKGYKIVIKPFVFLTEPSGVGCKGLIVRFIKNAVQTYQFRKKFEKFEVVATKIYGQTPTDI